MEMEDLLPSVRLTWAEFHRLPIVVDECVTPNEIRIGLRWKRDLSARRYSKDVKPYWVMGEYIDAEGIPAVVIVWRRILVRPPVGNQLPVLPFAVLPLLGPR
jgi:hypothetical protein